MSRFRAHVDVAHPMQETFAWHERPGALPRLTPPWEPVRVERAPESLEVGTKVVLRLAPVGRWVAEHVEYSPPHRFRDVQRSGPFASWDHTHLFQATGDTSSRLTDDVRYRLPGGALGEAVAGRGVRRHIERMFRYRHATLVDDLAAHAAARGRGATPMHVAVTGSSGLIGSQLVAFLTTGGHRVTRLVRRPGTEPDKARWDPATGAVDTARLRDVDAVVHLAGAPIAQRWTEQHKRRILDSRVQGTALLASTLARMDDGPRVLVCASGINAYGYDRGDDLLTEESEPGGGFLGDVVRQWEVAADPAREAGLRVVHVRTGIVQSPAGGALRVQLPLFWLGLGGRIGSGRQWVSWISIDDTVGLYAHALTTPDLSGALNATAPQPVTNAEYTRVLGRVLRRPTPLWIPPFGPAVLLGRQGARETALCNLRVRPGVAEATGYTFRHPDLETALRHVLGRARP